MELAFNNACYELDKDDADILVQLKTSTILWHKERLLNIGLDYLPGDCDKIAWVDADIIFCNDRWVDETAKLLESYVVVQPYSFVIRLPRGVDKVEIDRRLFGNMKGQKNHGIGYGIANFGKGKSDIFLKHWHTGSAWAARRSVFDKHGFYDRLILGSGDSLMGHAFYNNKRSLIRNLSSEKMIIDQDNWIDKVYQEIKSSVYYTHGLILHLWHGQPRNKLYFLRFSILKKFNFDPTTDLKVGDNNCWMWATDKPGLHKWAKRYFWLRNEEGSLFCDVVLISYKLSVKWMFLKYSLRAVLAYKKVKLKLLLLSFFDRDNHISLRRETATGKVLVVKGKAGMGNRIEAVLAGIIYSKITGRLLYIDWRDDMYSHKRENVFYRFFESPDVVSSIFRLQKTSSIAPSPWQKNLDRSVNEMINRFGPAGASVLEYISRYSIDISKIDYNEDILVMYVYNVNLDKIKDYPEKFPDEWKNLSRDGLMQKLLTEHLFIQPHIRHMAEEFRANFFKTQTIGVHIRYTDNTTYPTHEVSLNNYLRIIERMLEENPNANIFLATDSTELLREYQDKYSNILTTAKWYPHKKGEKLHGNSNCPNRIQNGIEALVEMYLLAHCDYLVFSRKSSFGRVCRYLSCLDESRIFDVENLK